MAPVCAVAVRQVLHHAERPTPSVIQGRGHPHGRLAQELGSHLRGRARQRMGRALSRWELVSGGGTLSAYSNNGVGRFVAPATAATVVLRLRRQSGPAHHRTVGTYTLHIVAPSDALISRDVHSPLFHTQNTCSVGFSGLVEAHYARGARERGIENAAKKGRSGNHVVRVPVHGRGTAGNGPSVRRARASRLPLTHRGGRRVETRPGEVP